MKLVIFILLFFPVLDLFSQETPMRVMTFNIRYANSGDGVHDWMHRRPLVKSIIQFHQVDLLGVREALRSQLDDMVIDMPEYEWYGVCRTDGSTSPKPDGEFSAILYRKDKLEILEGNTFWLSDTPDKIGSVGWDAALPRIVTWVKFKDKTTGNVFFHFNTHFDHIGKQARRESAKLILKKIQELAGNAPVVLTGDFNCGPEEDPYEILTKSDSAFKLMDTEKESEIPHHGPTATFAGSFEISGLIDHEIDFIFTNHFFKTLRHAVLSDNWNGFLASDHLPVMAEISEKVRE